MYIHVHVHVYIPVSGGVIAEVRKEVIVEFPEDVQCDSAVRGGD